MEVVSRRVPIDFHTRAGIANSTPDVCTYNFADTNVLTPNYPTETSMELTITSVQFPNVLTAVQNYNNTFFLVSTSGAVPIVLPNQNFKGLSGLAQTITTALVAATGGAWTVSTQPNNPNNLLSYTAPANLTQPVQFVFTTTLVNGLLHDPMASACNLMGFKQNDVMTFTAGQTRTSTVPCQASGASTIYIACDLFSLDSATIEVFGQQRQGSLLGKLNVTDPPWTVPAYQDQLSTFTLRMPAYNVSQLTIYLLNEYRQPCQMPCDWTMSGVVTYYQTSPWVALNQKIDTIAETLTNLWLTVYHSAQDEAKRAKLQAKAARDFEEFQGRTVQQ